MAEEKHEEKYSPFKDIAAFSNLEPLSQSEIEDFFHDIDRDNDGSITFEELEAKLEEVHQEIAPNADKHHLHHPERRFMGRQASSATNPDPEKGAQRRSSEHDGLHAFLCALMPDCGSSMNKEEFIQNVRSWNVPSQKMVSVESEDAEDDAYEHRMTWYRKLRAHWSVEGPRLIFLFGVFLLTLGFFLWQGLYYNYNQTVRAAVGWGVVMAKFCAGAIYPVLFFMVLSMSRWFSTAMRRFYWISRFVDWDRSQSFHIWMACIGLLFASLHAIGHLTGTFLTGSRPDRQPALANLLGADQTPATYASFVRKLPGWSGVVTLGLYWIIAILSIPRVRRWSYELFQLGHLLMFPFLGLLCAHGTAKILQYPMLGFWLSFPFLLIIVERWLRLIRGFIRLRARLEVLDDDTVAVTVKQPRGKNWRYQAGQYVFLQVPSISLFQWHPFTISACIGDELQLHIQTSGDWTGRLRDLPTHKDISVGIDGPFGAPAQRFYDFDRSLIIGAGVGITPFSAIITDLEQHLGGRKDPWAHSRLDSRAISRRSSATAVTGSADSPDGRRVDPSAIEPARDDPATSSSTTTTTTTPSPSTPIKPPHPPPATTAAAAATTSNNILVRAQDERLHSTSDDTSASRRRVDFHWMVRDRNHLAWFSSLLNRAADLADSVPRDRLELNIATHITARRRGISTHVFRYLLDAYRTRSAPVSALTGLRTRSHFGRPDLENVLLEFYRDEVARMKRMKREEEEKGGGTFGRGEKVGVFFCGSPKIGRVLADTCAELTARARADGSKVRFVFMMEVFG